MGEDFDFHIHAFGEGGDLDGGTSGKIACEIGGVGLVHAGEVSQVGHKNRSFDDVRKIKALVLQDQLDVLKRALGLRADVTDNKHPSLRHDWYLTGTEKESAQANCLAVRADRNSGARGVNHSFAFTH